MKLISRKKETYITNRILQGAIALKYTTYYAFAAEIGVIDTTVRNYVNKGVTPTLSIQQKIALKLGVPAVYLFNTTELKNRKHKNTPAVLVSPLYTFPDDAVFPIGVRKSRFRATKTYTVMRPVLYALLLAENIKLSELAEYLGVTPRSVMSYIYTVVEPKADRIHKLEQLFNLPIACILYTTENN